MTGSLMSMKLFLVQSEFYVQSTTKFFLKTTIIKLFVDHSEVSVVPTR